MGRTTLLGSFSAKQEFEFVIVRHLTVNCLLGGDFLQAYKLWLIVGMQSSSWVITNTIPFQLHWGNHPFNRKLTPLMKALWYHQQSVPYQDALCKWSLALDSHCPDVTNVLVEPSKGFPPHLCLACSLSSVNKGENIILQVMNISSTPVTVYKGIKLATAIPEHNILFIANDAPMPDICQNMPALNQINLSHLPAAEHVELTQLLLQFVDLFSTDDRSISQTSVVTHSIPTIGPPIHQPMC